MYADKGKGCQKGIETPRELGFVFCLISGK